MSQPQPDKQPDGLLWPVTPSRVTGDSNVSRDVGDVLFQLLKDHPQWMITMAWSEHLACFTIRFKTYAGAQVLEHDTHLSRLTLAMEQDPKGRIISELAKAERLFDLEINHGE